LLLGLRGRELRPRPHLLYRTYEKVAFWLSDISYTLYIFHFPILLLIYAGFYREQQLNLSAGTFLQFAGWLTFLVSLSWGAWLLFESRTPQVRKHLNRLLNQRVRSVKAS
ncbi:MAG: hypothetical protein AAFN92_15040, partial [Bacteroidota bacterium]